MSDLGVYVTIANRSRFGQFSPSNGGCPILAVIPSIAKRSRMPARRGGDLLLESLSQGWDTTTLNQQVFLIPDP